MKDQIKKHIHDPEQLEILYRTDKKGFEKAFHEIESELDNSPFVEFWKLRLSKDSQKTTGSVFNKQDLLYLLISCMTAGFLIQIPKIFNIDLASFPFYLKNTGLIIFFGLSLFIFLVRNIHDRYKIVVSGSSFLIAAVYINLLPNDLTRDSINLAFVHLPLMIWCLYGVIFIDFSRTDKLKRMDYIKYNGDLAIFSALIVIAGGIISAITIGMFQTIGLNIAEFYEEYIILVGMVSIPIIATLIIRSYSFITNKIAPIIANLFSPLVLITLVIYLVSIFIMGKNLYHDRNFLFIFNLMLLGVTAIIIFSISETSVHSRQRFNEWILFFLSIVTLLIDAAALSAIIYRVAEYGFTPNRTAVLGSNVLIFGNLLLIMIDLYRVTFQQKEISCVEMRIAKYLPIYSAWTIFVVFGFPLIFGCQ